LGETNGLTQTVLYFHLSFEGTFSQLSKSFRGYQLIVSYARFLFYTLINVVMQCSCKFFKKLLYIVVKFQIIETESLFLFRKDCLTFYIFILFYKPAVKERSVKPNCTY